MENPTITKSVWERKKLIKKYETLINPYIDTLIPKQQKRSQKVIYYRSTIRGTLLLISYKTLTRK